MLNSIIWNRANYLYKNGFGVEPIFDIETVFTLNWIV